MTLLIVDDERNIRVFMQRVLGRMSLGFKNIITAENGLDALDKAKASPPDIIITDVVMPWLSGHKLVEALKKVNPLCIYIFISGHDNVSYLQEAISLQVFRYILKPIRIQELTEVLTLAIEESKKLKHMAFLELYTFLDSVSEDCTLSKLEQQHRLYLNQNQNRFEIRKLRLKMAGFIMSLLEREGVLMYSEMCDFPALFACEEVADAIHWYFNCFSKLNALRKNALSGSLLGKARQYVEDHYMYNIGSREIAAHCGISTGYLSSLFGTMPDISIPQYITDVRLKHAIMMLQNDASVSEIAIRCGFNNANYFTKLFKRKYGKTPSEVKGKGLSYEQN